jgi:GxxExxY protein
LYTEAPKGFDHTEKEKGGEMAELLYEDLSFKIRNPIFTVHRNLGPGFREETYQRAAIRELENQNPKVEREKPIDIRYGGEIIDTYRLDLLVEGKIIVELKAVDQPAPIHEAQLLSCLKASGIRVGLLVNMGSRRIQIIRKIV